MARFSLSRHLPVCWCLLGLLASGCAALEAGRPLEEARQSFSSVLADPEVLARASLELELAKTALERAEEARRRGAASSVVEHLTYLARQRILIARETVALRKAEQALEAATAERHRILLEDRATEAEKAAAQAREQRLAAEAALRQAAEQCQAAELAATQLKAKAAEVEKVRRKAAAAEKRVRELEAQMEEMKAEQIATGPVITLGDVLFAAGESTLQAGAFKTIDQLAAFLNEYPARRIQIEGYTDDQGDEEYNLDLSIRRAEAVRDALSDRGVALERILIEGFGETLPVAPNRTAAGRQQNRRVELVISDEEGLFPARTP